MRVLIGAAVLLGCSATATSAHAAPRDALQRDLQGYAIASCLAAQDDAVLRMQGEGWAAIIFMGRGKGGIEDWAPLAQAVRAALNPADMYRLKPDRPTDPSPTMPLAYCAEIIDKPAVRTAIAAAARRLARAYR